MSHVYTPAKTLIAKADLDFDTADLRVMLCMSNTTCDTEVDAANLSDFTTIDEYDGSGYSQIDLANIQVNEDLANDRAEVDADNSNFGATVAAGTRQAVGALIYQFIDGTDANDIPVAWYDPVAAFPFDGNGGQINCNIDAEGFLQIT